MSLEISGGMPPRNVDPNTFAQQYATSKGISLEEAKAELVEKITDDSRKTAITKIKEIEEKHYYNGRNGRISCHFYHKVSTIRLKMNTVSNLHKKRGQTVIFFCLTND